MFAGLVDFDGDNFSMQHFSLVSRVFGCLLRAFSSTQLVACACLLIWLAPLHAQEVRLSYLLEVAMLRHPTSLQARNQAKASGFDLEAAKWGRFPTVSSDLRSDTNYVQSVAKLEQPLWAGGRIEGRIDVGQANLKAAQASVQEAELTALSQVGGSFFEVLRLSARLQTAQENIKEHERLRDLINRRVQAEISPPADLTLAQARLQQAMTEQLQIQRQLEAAKFSLSQWAGPLSGPLKEPSYIAYQRLLSDATVVEQAQKASAQRQRLQAQIESAQAQMQVAKAQGLPTVVAGYQYITAGPMALGLERGSTYIGLQFQPGAGLSALSGIQSAISKKEAAEQELAALDRSLENQAKTLYSDIDVLAAQLKPAQSLQDDTAELVESYLRQYQIGRKNWLDVLNALREKTQAIYNLADVRYGLLQSQVKLMLLVGELNADKTSVIHE